MTFDSNRHDTRNGIIEPHEIIVFSWKRSSQLSRCMAEQLLFLKEIKAIAVDKAVFIPVNPRHLSYDKMKRIIPSFLFLKEKFDPNGNFEKL